jgi:hypothetical protein
MEAPLAILAVWVGAAFVKLARQWQWIRYSFDRRQWVALLNIEFIGCFIEYTTLQSQILPAQVSTKVVVDLQRTSRPLKPSFSQP